MRAKCWIQIFAEIIDFEFEMFLQVKECICSVFAKNHVIGSTYAANHMISLIYFQFAVVVILF